MRYFIYIFLIHPSKVKSSNKKIIIKKARVRKLIKDNDHLKKKFNEKCYFIKYNYLSNIHIYET